MSKTPPPIEHAEDEQKERPIDRRNIPRVDPPMGSLVHWPARARIAIALFAFGYLCFAALSQLNLWHNVGEGTLPGLDRILARYHGVKGESPLAKALDPARPEDDPLHMYAYLGDYDKKREQNLQVVTAWIEAGAPEQAWTPVSKIIMHEDRCLQCHVKEGAAEHLIFDSYASVADVAIAKRVPMPLGKLFVTAHNHLFAFLVAAFLLSLLLALCPIPTWARTVLVGGAFLGALVDVAGWFLTRAEGAPWHHLVMAGGGAFGACTTAMALVVLWHALRPASRD